MTLCRTWRRSLSAHFAEVVTCHRVRASQRSDLQHSIGRGWSEHAMNNPMPAAALLNLSALPSLRLCLLLSWKAPTCASFGCGHFVREHPCQPLLPGLEGFRGLPRDEDSGRGLGF